MYSLTSGSFPVLLRFSSLINPSHGELRCSKLRNSTVSRFSISVFVNRNHTAETKHNLEAGGRASRQIIFTDQTEAPITVRRCPVSLRTFPALSVMPDFQRSVSVAVTVAAAVAKYVRITFIRKNSVRTP